MRTDSDFEFWLGAPAHRQISGDGPTRPAPSLSRFLLYCTREYDTLPHISQQYALLIVNMPSKRLVLGDLTSQLGLRAFYTKKGTDFKANPAVAQLWDRLTELCKVHYLKAMEFIPRCPEIYDAQAKLLKEHGPAIWSADDPRPWLMNPGEGSTSSPYEKDLYWHNLSHQKL